MPDVDDPENKDQGTPTEEDVISDLTGGAEKPAVEPEPSEPGKPAEGGEETPPKQDGPIYEVEGFEFTPTWLKDAREKVDNYQHWDAVHHKKGLDLNQREEELKTKEELTESYRKDAEDHRELKAILDAHPEAQKLFNQIRTIVQQGGGQLRVEMKQLEEKFDAREDALKTKDAIANLKGRIPDFDYEPVKSFLDSIDWDNREQVIEFQHNAYKGSQLKELIQKALAEQSQKDARTPRTPPLSLQAGQTTPDEFDQLSAEEQEASIVRDLVEGKL
jgi:hypothetical protein